MFSKSEPFRLAITILFWIALFCIPGCLTTPKQEDSASPSVLLEKMLRELRREISKKNLRLSIGNFTYQDSSVPSSFARYLSQEISAAIHRTKTFKEIEQSFQSLGEANERSLKEIADRGMVVGVDGPGKKAETAEDVCLYTIVP